MTPDECLRWRIEARMWKSQASALYEEWAHALRTHAPEYPGPPFDKITMRARIDQLVTNEVDALRHLRDKP